MMKKLTILMVLMFAVSALAVTPTGTVVLTWANANGDNTCPAGPGPNSITTRILDSNGLYSTANQLGSLTAGSYCIYAHYNGDSAHLPSDATPFLHTVNPLQVSTVTTVTSTPEPSTQGSGVTISGGVQ